MKPSHVALCWFSSSVQQATTPISLQKFLIISIENASWDILVENLRRNFISPSRFKIVTEKGECLIPRIPTYIIAYVSIYLLRDVLHVTYGRIKYLKKDIRLLLTYVQGTKYLILRHIWTVNTTYICTRTYVHNGNNNNAVIHHVVLLTATYF